VRALLGARQNFEFIRHNIEGGNEMAYSDKVVDHYEHPRNVGSRTTSPTGAAW